MAHNKCHSRFDGPTFSVTEHPVFYNFEMLWVFIALTLFHFAAVCCAKWDSSLRLHLFTLAREPEIVNCQVGHVKCFVREDSGLKKRN